jgi:hypothetical protein
LRWDQLPAPWIELQARIGSDTGNADIRQPSDLAGCLDQLPELDTAFLPRVEKSLSHDPQKQAHLMPGLLLPEIPPLSPAEYDVIRFQVRAGIASGGCTSVRGPIGMRF